MTTVLWVLASVLLFLVGVRLSAFFSGSETGFYRLSPLRLSIESDSGDRTAARLYWLSRNPAYFVATTLVGNNVANYLTTLAIGIASTTLLVTGADWAEIVFTALAAPVVFVFGELVPKYLYYRAPRSLLRRDAGLFLWFYWLFLPVSFPLIWIAKGIDRLSGETSREFPDLLGRKRLVQALSQGHQQGLLTDVQTLLSQGVLDAALDPVTESLMPLDRVLGLPDDADRQTVLDYARRFSVSQVVVRRAGSEDDWYGYLRVVDVVVCRKAVSTLVRTMPRIEAGCSKLEALLELRRARESRGLVVTRDRVLGVVSEQGLLGQLFHPRPRR